MTPSVHSQAWIVGYDPGGDGAHGVAACAVHQEDGRWRVKGLHFASSRCLEEAAEWVQTHTLDGPLLAIGVDTLTEWNGGSAGWRPADRWLRRAYPTVQNSVAAPNSIFGSMPVGGMAFLTLLRPRLVQDGGWITEAHPKVLFYALTGRKHAWAEQREAMAAWLLQELNLDPSTISFGDQDHPFDAALSLLPALRALNGEWALDLHSLQDPRCGARICPLGPTHYWWPQPSLTPEG